MDNSIETPVEAKLWRIYESLEELRQIVRHVNRELEHEINALKNEIFEALVLVNPSRYGAEY